MKSYIIMRTHSQTDRQTLWKVMSRPLKDMNTAEGELDFHRLCETNPKHKFFIIETEASISEMAKS